MHYQRKKLAEMPKCYAIAMLDAEDESSFVVGVEKEGPIRRFALDGSPLETIAEGPGGLMTITQVPGRSDQFLATCEFYSPNCGGDTARIVSYTQEKDGSWTQRVLCDLPYVHRFGLLRGKDESLWLIACSIKGSCEYKEDWREPGCVYVARIDTNIENYNKNKQLKLKVLSACQLKNHGYYAPADKSFALIATAAGVFKYVPPAKAEQDWQISCLAVAPTSDMTLADLDGDGELEMLTLSPFHGDTLRIYHLNERGTYDLVWEDPEKHPFLHAIWSGKLNGEICALVGHRQGKRELIKVFYNAQSKTYETCLIDSDRGPANCLVYSYKEKDYIIAANREVDELALYSPVE